MMPDPESFYNGFIKNKSLPEISKLIRELKRQNNKLKKDLEKSTLTYDEDLVSRKPSPEVIISLNREYIQRAIDEYNKKDSYKYTQKELVAINFNENIKNISQIEISYNGFFYPHYSYILNLSNKKKVFISKKYIGSFKKTKEKIKKLKLTKKEVLNILESIHIGEWEKIYEPYIYGICINDGYSWKLKITYKNGKILKYSGDNLAPYNFQDLENLVKGETSSWDYKNRYTF